jgi:uncharacterized membrane protein YeaQ/YmgE (transglycosylase-associated protein family)
VGGGKSAANRQIEGRAFWRALCSSRAAFALGSGALTQTKELVMSILLFIVFGFVVGLLARAIMPGTQKMGILGTSLLGIAGSFVGGFLVALITSNRVTELNTAGIIGSIVGALLVLFLVGRFSGGRALV